jgi:hypothetical protein
MGFVKAAKNGHIRFKRKTKEENVQVKKNILCKKFWKQQQYIFML